jgi:hypothetical protein
VREPQKHKGCEKILGHLPSANFNRLVNLGKAINDFATGGGGDKVGFVCVVLGLCLSVSVSLSVCVYVCMCVCVGQCSEGSCYPPPSVVLVC